MDMDINMYDAQAAPIVVDHIATNINNRIVLRRIKRNEDDVDNKLFIKNRHNYVGEHCVDYVPEGADDMGWLGYFVSKNEHLMKLYIGPFEPTSGSSVRDVI